MKIIVIGGGEIGSRLTRLLSENKHDVVLVEIINELCQELADNLNATLIHGDGTKPDVLEEAGIEDADALVVATGEDETNLLSCLVAREMSSLRIITRATKEEYKKIFLKIGVNSIVSPETSTVDQLEAMITEPDVVDMALIHEGNLELIELEVEKKSNVMNKPITKIEFPKESLVVAIKRGEKFIIPEEEEKLMAGDKVVIIVRKTLEEKIRGMFKP
ncbi:MAG: NAD-binding protein [Candidatus Aenigmarchaeota archaeon]|nr:NAD-binding protein [Candidatus Aenigmarchaeota archaeon]MCK4531360.1 NAD-binding protein [Candidatus Aenigmarchaeota archaeon]